MKHIVSVVVRNNSGVLARVSSLFGRRGFNIESLTVSATDDPHISRITVVAGGEDATLDQICKQTAKLVDIISVRVLAEDSCVARELLLVKVECKEKGVEREIADKADAYGALILDITEQTMILELTGPSAKIDRFMDDLSHSGAGCAISKVCRTGITAMERGL